MRIMETYREDDYLQLSGIQHFVFCRRQWALIVLENAWIENYLTLDGRQMHENAHSGKELESRGEVLISRGLPVHSAMLGLTGLCDIVEFHKTNEIDGVYLKGKKGRYHVVPIEYKRGKPKVGHEDIAQVVAQTIALEEMLATEIHLAYIYYGAQRHRFEVHIDDEVRDEVQKYANEMHQYFNNKFLPRVKKQSKCQSCSLLDICLPGLPEADKVSSYIKGSMNEKVT